MMKMAKKAVIALAMMTAAAPAVAGTTTTVDTTFYSDLLAFIKAQFAYEGAEYSAFQSLNLSADQMSKLSSAFASLNSAQLTLVQYLQNKVSVA